eukprot:866218-Amphidinium_carterae.1
MVCWLWTTGGGVGRIQPVITVVDLKACESARNNARQDGRPLEAWLMTSTKESQSHSREESVDKMRVDSRMFGTSLEGNLLTKGACIGRWSSELD